MNKKMILTKNQTKAINTIDKNLLVNAGAGSGKTKVLVDRYINILENGNLEKNKEIESIVAITFTKKAQGEMKERIRKEIIKKTRHGSEWMRIYEDLEKANISTIHAFCSKILSENPIEAEVEPGFSILEEYEKHKFIDEILKNILTKDIESDKKAYSFLKHFTPFSIEESMFKNNIIDNLKKIYFDVRTTGNTIDKIEKLTIENIDSLESDFKDLDYIKNKIYYLTQNCPKSSKLYKLKTDDIWLDFYNDKSNNIDKDTLIKLSHISNKFGRYKKLQDDIDDVTEKIKEIMKLFDKMNKDVYISLFHMLRLLDKEYTKKKQKIYKLDYEDLQILTLKLFENKEILDYYRDKFKYIMIDEFQDTDSLQKNILYKLCSVNKDLDKNNLFVVGDPKQSIYRFRGADVSVFDDVSDDISRQSKDLVISLDDNFRTVNTIMDVINDFFTKVMGKNYQILNSNKNTKNKLDVEILGNEDIVVPKGESKGEFNKKFEAELIAKRIKYLVKHEGYKYNDFAILFRAMTDVSFYEEALNKYNVPFSNVSGEGLLYSQEVMDILNALKSISNQEDFLSRVSFFRSPLVGASDDEVLDYFVNNKRSESINIAHKIIDKFNGLKNILSVKEILKELIADTNLIKNSLLLYNGLQKKSNIERFIKVSEEISKEKNMNLDEYLNYIEDFKKYGQDFEKENIQSDDEVVTLLTIHKSKGLEFKVVIIPQTAKQFQNNNSDILFSKYKGIGIKHLDENNKPSKSLSHIYSNLLDFEKAEDSEENKRILYVAMTRAEEKLILACQSLGKNYKDSFKTMIKENIDSKSIKYIDDVDIETHKKREITSMPKIYLSNLSENTDNFSSIWVNSHYTKKDFDTLSISSYMKFKNCNRSFYYEYYKRPSILEDIKIKKDISNSLSSIEKGVVIHKICELYKPGLNINQLIEKVLNEKNILVTRAKINELKPYIDNFIKLNDFYDKEQYSEIKFYYNLGEYKLSGVIDKIIFYKDKIDIIDFKSNNVVNKKNILIQYSTQMQFYTSVARDLFKSPVRRARLMLLQTGEYLDVDISNKALDENIKDILNFIEFINSHSKENDYKRNTSICKFCKHKNICK